MPFQPGQSGCPGGRPKTKPFADALRRLLLEDAADTLELAPKPRRIDVLAMTLLEEATAGTNRVQAIKEIRDTLDGRPAQALEHSGTLALTHEQALLQLDTDDADGDNATPPA